jgi:hypothetical protein
MAVEINCADIELHLQSNSRHGFAFFNDLSKNKYTLRRSGGVIHSTEQVKVGSTSFFSPSTTNDYLRVEGLKENFNFIHQKKSSFTIQTWCYLSSSNSTSSTILSNSWSGVSHDGFRFYIDHSSGGAKPTFTTYVNWTPTQGYKSAEITTTTDISLNAWNHLAVVYDNDTEQFTIYINGVDSTGTNKTWTSPVLLRTAGKSLDLFWDDEDTPDAFHGFLQDVQILTKPLYEGNFTHSNELLFDRCQPARVNLKVPGRPEYIYFFDGETTKCYRKTNERVYSDGITLTEDHVAATRDDFDATRAEKPVLIYDSCADCLGLSDFFSIMDFGAITRIGNIDVTDVQNQNPGEPLVGVDIYELTDTAVTITMDDVATIEQTYPDAPGVAAVPEVYGIQSSSATITISNVAAAAESYSDLPVAIPVDGDPVYGVGREPLIAVVVIKSAASIDGAYPDVTGAVFSGGQLVRVEGTSTSPAPPDQHSYDEETGVWTFAPFAAVNRPGDWQSFV